MVLSYERSHLSTLAETCVTAAAFFADPTLNSNPVSGSIPGNGDTLGVAVLCGDSFLQLI